MKCVGGVTFSILSFFVSYSYSVVHIPNASAY